MGGTKMKSASSLLQNSDSVVISTLPPSLLGRWTTMGCDDDVSCCCCSSSLPADPLPRATHCPPSTSLCTLMLWSGPTKTPWCIKCSLTAIPWALERTKICAPRGMPPALWTETLVQPLGVGASWKFAMTAPPDAFEEAPDPIPSACQLETNFPLISGWAVATMKSSPGDKTGYDSRGPQYLHSHRAIFFFRHPSAAMAQRGAGFAATLQYPPPCSPPPLMAFIPSTPRAPPPLCHRLDASTELGGLNLVRQRLLSHGGASRQKKPRARGTLIIGGASANLGGGEEGGGGKRPGGDAKAALFVALGAVATLGPMIFPMAEQPPWWEGGGAELGDVGFVVSALAGVAVAGSWILPAISAAAEEAAGQDLASRRGDSEESDARRRSGVSTGLASGPEVKFGDHDSGKRVNCGPAIRGEAGKAGEGGWRMAVLFRGRSRCTYGFEGQHEGKFFDLPIAEWSAACACEGLEGARLVRMRCGGEDGSEADAGEQEGAAWWIEIRQGQAGEEALKRVARRCILVHGLYRVAAWGACIEEAVEQAGRRQALEEGAPIESWRGRSWRMRVVGVGRKEDLRREEVEERVASLGGILGVLDGRRDEACPQLQLCCVEVGTGLVFLGELTVRGPAVGKKGALAPLP